MKKLLAIATLLTIFSLTAAAQECGTENQTALYNKFLADRKGKPEQQKAASITAKEYLSKFGNCPSEEEKKITEYLKNWLTDYETKQREQEAKAIENSCVNAVNKTPAQAFELCQPYLARDPENLRAHLLLSAAGIKETSNSKLHERTVISARKALELIKANKTVNRS